MLVIFVVVVVVVVLVVQYIHALPPVFLSDVARSRRAAGKLKGAEPKGSSAIVGVAAAIGVPFAEVAPEIGVATELLSGVCLPIGEAVILELLVIPIDNN